MDPQRWQEIERLYLCALEREPAQRSSFLAEACRDDSDLRREVESMLAQTDASLRLQGSAWETETIAPGEPSAQLAVNSQLGPYRIEGVLGAGGMGAVYRAVDTRLGRKVAIKVAREKFSARFEREARTISALNHPNICTLYDVGPNYMVTELVEGETLRAWLKRPPDSERSIEIARQVLEALRAAHNAGIVHRDLKPENIMIRTDGYVKVLDFGLAKRMPASLLTPPSGTADLSLPGQLLGTIAYMSPEQAQGQEPDPRGDLFAFGIVLYEMLEGRHPWPRDSAVETMHAILHDDPPPAQTAWSGVLDKLLAKDRENRYASAEAVLQAISSTAAAPAPRPRATTRLIVLPFRILRSHEASDFLAVSLPDAIASSLTAIDSLLVRSTMVASRFPSAGLDLKAVAEQAQVDAVVTGSLVSDGKRIRVTAQLIQVPDGTLLWTTSSHVSLGDIFQLHDELVDHIVKTLALPLTSREQRALKHDVPANAMAYELYLRGNQLVIVDWSAANMTLARDLYLRSVEADPKYAPAWACLGRAYRFIGKYGIEDPDESFARAEEAFKNALALSPDLGLAHNFYTLLQTDTGRSLETMARLLKRAQEHPNDPNILAGLVHACRYCGLLEASVSADALAKRLDPNIRTSVVYSYWNLGEFDAVLDHCSALRDGDAEVHALAGLGRNKEAIARCLELEKSVPTKEMLQYAMALRFLLEGDREKSLAALTHMFQTSWPMRRDPESQFVVARSFVDLGEIEGALDLISQALAGGYWCYHMLLHERRFESLRANPRFTELLTRAAALDLEARKVFVANGGNQLLGTQVAHAA